MNPLSQNPFAVLTAVVAPAVLTNACSVLCLGTSNRLARVVDRTRVLAAELASLEIGSPGFQLRVSQIERLQLRARMLMTAMRTLYAAVGSFAAAALVSVMGSAAAFYEMRLLFEASAVAALAIGVVAVSALVTGCVVMVHEARLALRNLAEEAELARTHYQAVIAASPKNII